MLLSESTRHADQANVFALVSWIIPMILCVFNTATLPPSRPLQTMAIVFLWTAVYIIVWMVLQKVRVPIISVQNCIMGEYSLVQILLNPHAFPPNIHIPLASHLAAVFSVITPFVPPAFGLLSLHFNRRALHRRTADVEGELPDRLRDGTIRLLSVRWLLAREPSSAMLRRQDLPEAAFVPAAEAVRALRAGRVGALSYRWLDKDHPDPEQFELFHLREVLAFFRTAPEGGWLRQLTSPSTAIEALFWEYVACACTCTCDQFDLAQRALTPHDCTTLGCSQLREPPPKGADGRGGGHV